MANFSSLKQSIQNYIKQNGNKEITGNLLQNILLSMVTTMGDDAINDNASDISDIQNEIQNIITTRLNTGALYAGYATPSTTPAVLTGQEVFYLATQAGTYTNFHFNGGDDPIVLAKDGIYFIVSGDDDDDWNAEPMLLLDDEPTAGSDNLVKSRGCIASIGEGSFIKNFNVTKSGSTTLNTGTYIDFALDKYYKIFCRSTDNKVSYINVIIVLGTNNYQVITVPNGGYIIFKSKKTVQNCNIQNQETIEGTDDVTLSFYSLNDASKEVQLFLLGELTQTIDSKPTKSSKNLVYSGGVAIEDEAINSKFFLSSSYSGLVADTGTGYISASTETLNSFVYPVIEGKTYSMAGFNALNNKAMFTNNVPQVGNIALLVDIIDGKVTVPDGYAYMLIDVNVPSINDLNYCFVYIESPLGNEVVKLRNLLLQITNVVPAILSKLGSGALYAGYATPSTNPAASTGQPVFYVATQAGTYTHFLANYDTPIVLAKDGIYFIVSGVDDDDWNAETIIEIDDEPTAGSDNLVKSGSLIASIGEGSFIKNSNVTKSGSTTLNTGTYIDLTLNNYYKIFCNSSANKISYINIIITKGSGSYQVIQVPNNGSVIFVCEKTVTSVNIQNTETIDGTDHVTISFYSLNSTSKEVKLYLLEKLTETIDTYPTKQSNNLVRSGGIEDKLDVLDAKFLLSSSYSGFVGDTGNGFISSATSTLNSFVYQVTENETYNIKGFSPLNSIALFSKSGFYGGMTALTATIVDGKITVPAGYNYMMLDVFISNITDIRKCFVYIETELSKYLLGISNKFKVTYTYKDFPCYGIFVGGQDYPSGVNSFHSDLIPLDNAENIIIRTAIATEYYAYAVLNSNFEIISSQNPTDTNLHTYSIDVTSEMKYLQVNCFSKFLGTSYQSFYIEIYYKTLVEKYVPKRIMCYGDSLTRGTGDGAPYPVQLQKIVGDNYQIENRGAGGETVPAIITRTGASPIIVTSDFVLPADTTPIQLGQTLTTMFGNKSFVFAQGGNIEKMMVNPCWVKGVECFIDYNDGVYKINRLEAGDEVKVPTGTSIYCGDRERYDNISYTVLFAGTNGGYSTASELADMLEKTGEYMDVPYIVLNFWATGNLPQGVTISDIQTEFRNRFGGRFLDIMLYFSTAAIYDAINQNLVEIDEPTQADLNNMAQGLPPASLLLQDNLHLNDAGKILLAQQVYGSLKVIGVLN